MMNEGLARTAKWLAAGIVAISVPAGAAPPQRGKGDAPAAVRELEACRGIAADAARLACFDAAAAHFAGAVEKREVVVLDDREIGRTRRSLFGFALPRIDFLRGKDGAGDGPEFSEIVSTVGAARGLGHGNWELVVDDATWQTTEPLRFPPRGGAPVRIKRGALGSYFLSVGQARAVRAMRVR